MPFAKELATLDDIAGGRVLVGVGSGGTGFDAYVLGQTELTPRQRHERFVEFVDALDALLRFEQPGSGGISFPGDWFVAHHARMVGTPARQPRMPLLIAGNGPKTIRLAARQGEGWVTTGGSEDDREAVVVGDRRARRAIRRRVRGIRSFGGCRPHSVDRHRVRLLARERRSVRGRRGPRGVARLHRCGRALAAGGGDLRRRGVRPRRDSWLALELAIAIGRATAADNEVVEPWEMREWYAEYLDACNRHDLDAIRSFVDPAVRRAHLPGGADAWVADMADLFRAFPDWRWRRIQLVVEDDRVAAHLRASGTHLGEFRGIAPTRRHANVAEFAMYRVTNGRIAEFSGNDRQRRAARPARGMTGSESHCQS